jgi:NADPH-dependent glutamate synthase beta subunit-like oxidoreductase
LSLYLPPHPYRLLVCLAACPPGRVVAYDELQRAVFDADEVLPRQADDRLRYHVATLRKVAVIGGWPASIVITRADVGLQLDARLWQRQTPGD